MEELIERLQKERRKMNRKQSKLGTGDIYSDWVIAEKIREQIKGFDLAIQITKEHLLKKNTTPTNNLFSRNRS
jgi:hypothetical protein